MPPQPTVLTAGQAWRRPARHARRSAQRLASLALLLLGACALPGLQLDLAATAPLLGGYGQASMATGSPSGLAQQHFDQGLRQAYAFNEPEAVRMFKAALAADPACALCAWGVAWQLGPNINNTARANQAEALRYADLARRNAATTSALGRALIDAMALRYGQDAGRPVPAPLLAEVCASPGTAVAHPLDMAYAQRLHGLLQRWPDDADLLSLWAEAELVATRGDMWGADGLPAGRLAELADRLDAVLAHQPAHTGLNHYLVHVLDSSPTPQRALAAADRLGALAPASPHLVHMPSHIHVRVGQFAQATLENQQALALDDALAADLQRQGFAISKDWRGHNLQFAWFAALMQGRGDLALQLARRRAERAAGASHIWAELSRSQPLLTLLRLQRWDAVMAEPVPASPSGLALALTSQARGTALLQLGRTAEARSALQQARAGAASVSAAQPGTGDDDILLRGMAQGAAESLAAQIALADGQPDAAVAAQLRAVALSKKADATEPPLLGASARPALGDVQLRAGQAQAAEATFRADLAAWPSSGWALRGLQRSLAAQGRPAEAQAVAAALQRDWPGADPALR